MQVFTRVQGGCDNHRCHNKKPRWENRTGDVNDVVPGSDGLRILEFEKKSELRFKLRMRELRFGLGRSKSIFGARRGQTSSLRRGAHVVDSDGKVRIERNCVCLSLLMLKNLKLKKVNKSFVPEPISCFSDSLCLFHVYVSWLYFWMWIYYNNSMQYILDIIGLTLQ